MRYIGSKLKLVDFIVSTVKQYCGDDISDKVFCDLFAGTGIVGNTFSSEVKKVIANDMEWYSFISVHSQLKGYNKERVEKIIGEFNNLQPDYSSNLYNAYADGGSMGRLYFTKENGGKIAAARKYLTKITNEEHLPKRDYFACLSSIVDASDKVANTMATYGAYAKTIQTVAMSQIEFKAPKTASGVSCENEVYKCDANELISEIRGDILYLDPPYNARQYGSNYHVLNALCLGSAPDTDSVTGLDGKYNKSKYCRRNTVRESLDSLIKSANFEWIFLSYNNEGLLTFDEIKSVMEKYGDYDVCTTDYQRYKADNNRNQAASKVTEYIHVLHKGFFTKKEENSKSDVHNKLRLVDLTDDTVAIESHELENVECNEKEEDAELPKIKIKCGKLSIGHESTKSYETNELVPVVSPMNYMGGKKKLIKTLKKYFPKNIDTFVDLFCGGATVGINSDAKTVVFNDNIDPLISMYEYMYTHEASDCISYIDSKIEEYDLVQGEEGEDNYYNFRDNYYNALPVEERHPLDLFVLMAYSFNNQIRFNVKKNWKFNIPFGANRSSFNGKMRENLVGFINALHKKECVFTKRDFRDFQYDNPDMFVYADPPYLISQATYNDGWDEEAENMLLNKLKQWDENGIKFALSNVLENKGKTNTILKDWAEKNGYNVIHIEKSYANSYYQRKERDSKTDEVLITNYRVEKTERNDSDI